MYNLEALWQFQQKDVEVDQCESQMRQDPMRVKLLRLKNFFKEQQDAMKNVENENERIGRTLAQTQSQFEALQARTEQELAQVEKQNIETAAQAEAQLAAMRDLIGRLTNIEQRLSQLMQDLNKSSRDVRSARQNAAKAKEDYAQLKSEYDKVFAAQSEKLDALTKIRDEAAKGIDPELMAKYQTVKKRCSTPIALLRGDQCGGCNMSQPAVVVSAAKKGERLVECETCGRIIYVKD